MESTKDKMSKIDQFESETRQAKTEVDEMNKKIAEMKMHVDEVHAIKEVEIQKAEKAIAEKLASELKQWELDEKISKLDDENTTIKQKMKGLEDKICHQLMVEAE